MIELRGDETDPLRSAVFQCLGAVSMCWEHPEGAGIFLSDRAAAVGDELVAFIHAYAYQEHQDGIRRGVTLRGQ